MSHTSPTAFDYLEQRLAQMRRLGLERHVQPHLPPEGVYTDFKGQRLVNFSSNDYLGLAQHPALRAAAIQAADVWGTSSSASRLVSGTLALHEELELAIATWKQTEAALIFNSGYQANIGVVGGLTKAGDQIFFDSLSHASLRDGINLSRATAHEFRHNDLEQLQQLLAAAPAQGLRVIITESVFSMDGDCAPLPALLQLAEAYDCLLLVDEAHGVGYYGAGLLAHLSVHSPRLIVVGTCGKALGSFGAYVASSQLVQQLLINRARSFIYTTALPAPVLAATRAAIELLESPEGAQRIAILRQHCQQVATTLEQANQSPIFLIPMPDVASALHHSQALRAQGFWIQAIRPPTVPTPRLRLTLSAAHTTEQVATMLAAVTALLGSVSSPVA
ncbi:MAG: 8-amino-7-oxononanoate synthase [Synechococcaceae cyanobacterium SM2_3_60]|nr:8-amino-7-oxononanoate synthase [Synechococcaceae cyanobacterium SM2_3_60]